ncbi:MAG TPA: septation protein SepH [Nocardioides sp.]
MAKLTFKGRSTDGKRLLLVDESGQEHSLVIDARLRRALSGVPESNGQLEIPMESSLRPRDIQTRIRAGESPESVAHAAGTSVEKIMPFAAPVMAERAHVAERAQLASVRRRAAESGARTLGEAVSAHLRSHNVDPGAVEWDAWRREDGRWTLTALYEVAGRTGTGTFSHDPRGNFVTVDDDDARWLVGDAAPAAATEPAADDLAAARQRRLSAVSGQEDMLGDDALGADAIEMVTDEESANETTMELSDASLGAEQPLEAYLDSPSSADPAGSADTDEATEAPDHPAAGQRSEPPAEPRAKPAKKRGRASVPSWDEIMFGGPSER